MLGLKSGLGFMGMRKLPWGIWSRVSLPLRTLPQYQSPIPNTQITPCLVKYSGKGLIEKMSESALIDLYLLLVDIEAD